MQANDPILLVEDNRIDQRCIERIFKELEFSNPLEIVTNGTEALSFLNDADTKPSLVILDINMPKMNGIEFLETIKQDTQLKTIPVVVLTTSKNSKDRQESYAKGAAGYIIKPADYKEFTEVIKNIHAYWSLSLNAFS